MVPTPGCTSGAFSTSSWAIHARSRAVSAPICGGALSSAVMCPAVSITTMAMPSERTWRARASKASVAASGRGSLRPANTRPSSVLVCRASSRRWRATTHAYHTVIPPSSSASAATTGGPARRSAALRATGGPRHEALHAEVRNERRRNRHAAVGLLAGLEQRRDGARQRQPGRVERVHELGLRAGGRAIADAGAPRLKVGERARTRHFEPLSHAGRPRFEIVCLRAREAEIPGRQQHYAIRHLESLQDGLGVPRQELVLGGGVGGTGESHQLHLVELMHPQQATRILAGGARFAPEARRVGGVAERQPGGVEDLVAMQVGEGDFGRGDEKQIVGRRLVHVVLELGDLAGALHHFALDDERRLHLDVAVLSGVQVDHEGDEGADELRPGAHKDRKPRAGELRAAREVQHSQCFPDLPVWPAALRGRLAPRAHDLVVRGVAIREFREREVRDVEQLLLEGCLDTLELRLEGVDPLAQRAARPADVRRERPLLLHQTRIGLGGFVALPLELVELAGERAAAHVQRLELVEQPLDARIAAPGERGAHLLGRGAQQLEIDHGATAWGVRARGRGTRNSDRPGSRTAHYAPWSPRRGPEAWHRVTGSRRTSITSAASARAPPSPYRA